MDVQSAVLPPATNQTGRFDSSLHEVSGSCLAFRRQISPTCNLYLFDEVTSAQEAPSADVSSKPRRTGSLREAVLVQ